MLSTHSLPGVLSQLYDVPLCIQVFEQAEPGARLTGCMGLQACSGLAESGVADERTWRALLGNAADPALVHTLLSGDDTDTDLTSTHETQGVWLVGEQRWERRR